jgi:hypothetical protein
MNNTEAKFILNAYRPNGRDASDPTFAGALAQAKADPALGAWLARAQAHDGAMTAKVREIAAPAGLREAILAGARVSDGQAAHRAGRRAWWLSPGWMAMAAAVAVIVTAGVAFWPKAVGTAPEALATFALDDMIHGRHGSHGEASRALQVLLSEPSTRLGAGLPVDFATLEATGCRTIAYQGHQVLELCFQHGQPVYHLYIIKQEDMPELSVKAAPAVIAKATGAAAVWSDARYHYALVSDAGEKAIRRVL